MTRCIVVKRSCPFLLILLFICPFFTTIIFFVKLLFETTAPGILQFGTNVGYDSSY